MSARHSSWDRSGGNDDFVSVAAGERRVLMEAEGPGCITHLWFTLDSDDPLIKRNLVLRMFWDGYEHPSVECPIGDFFGNGWGSDYLFRSLPLACAPRDGRAMVCYFPMPFGKGARIEAENQSASPVDKLYFAIDFENRETVGPEVGRFHAWYRQELTTPASARENEWEAFGPAEKHATDEGNYVFCEAEGAGHFVGLHLYVNCPTALWYGEGDEMFRIDGEEWPVSLHGTGTEDYFNTAWCPSEQFAHPYFGIARVPSSEGFSRGGWLGRTHLYRFHIDDPIRFQRSLRGSIEHGHSNALTLELASVAYWYQAMPGIPLPPLPPVLNRVPRAEITPRDIHRWRDAWRREQGGRPLWGNE